MFWTFVPWEWRNICYVISRVPWRLPFPTPNLRVRSSVLILRASPKDLNRDGVTPAVWILVLVIQSDSYPFFGEKRRVS